MTLEVDPDRATEVADRLRRHRDQLDRVREHVSAARWRVASDGAADGACDSIVATADELASTLASVAGLLDGLVERARAADVVGVRASFAGGTAVCSAIQLVSPIPARPSTSGTTGVIDTGGVAADAGSLARTATAPVLMTGRSLPLVTLAAAFADALMCRLRVGSGAGISTRRVVDDDGEEVFEGSRSDQPYMTATGEPLDPDPVVRDRQMWRAEHRNDQGFETEPYPGFPAYEVNAP